MDKAKPAYTQEQVTLWLSRLARGMQRHGQTVFLIEQLQPSWLPRRWQVAAYGLATRLGDGLLAAWSCGLTLGILFVEVVNVLTSFAGGFPTPISTLLPVFSYASLAGAAVAALSLVLLDFRRLCSGPGMAPPPAGAGSRLLHFCLRGSAATVLVYGLLLALLAKWTESDLLFFSLHFSGPALVFGVARGNLGKLTLRAGDSDVSAVERLVWSWRGVGLGVALAALTFGAGVALAIFLPDSFSDAGQIAFIAILGITFTLVLILPLRGAFRFAVRETKAAPNEGMRISLANARSVGWKTAMGATLLALALAALTDSGLDRPTVLLAGLFGLGCGFLAGGWYGGVDVVRHYALRFLLARRGHLPWNLAAFLDYCADELHLLQRVGGGYMFLHRYLLEYFAGLGEDTKEKPAASSAHTSAVAG